MGNTAANHRTLVADFTSHCHYGNSSVLGNREFYHGRTIGKLTADARAAGCTFKSFPSEGRTHTADKVAYKTNPPTSGNHNPTPALDGIYRPGNTPPKENLVHTLEHGRIEFQYKPGAPAADVTKLRRLASEPLKGTAGYHVVLFENNTKMPAEFAATAWAKSLTCSSLTPQALAAMREFR